jgi:hypothetical protein
VSSALKGKVMKRGVVVSPYFTFDGTTLHFPGTVGIEPEHLRHYLLYWDKIEFPNNNIINIGSSPDVDYLEQCGMLQRTRVTLSKFSGNIGFAYVQSQAIAARELAKKEPGQWTIAQSGPRLFLPENLSDSVPSLEVELYNSLPSPGENVSLEDILQFKERYADELLAFRSRLDELYLEITNSGDIPRAKIAAIEKLEQSIKNIDRAAEQSWASKLISGIKIEFNLPTVLERGAAVAGLAALAGLPLSLGAALGAAGAVINIGLSQGPKVGRGLQDFA